MKKQKIPAGHDSNAGDPSDSLINKAIRLVESGHCEEALRLLHRCNSSAFEVLNARGVCLMRMGRIDDAVRLFRTFVLHSGGTWLKPDLPVIYRTNFATALLLAGLPGGVRDTLLEISEDDHPSVLRLRNAMDSWRKGLTWWQKFNWKCGLPPKVPIRIDFAPGEFFDPLTARTDTPAVMPLPQPSPPLPATSEAQPREAAV